MATYARTVRRGLPRTAGGDPWPAAAAPVDTDAAGADGAGAAAEPAAAAPAAEPSTVTPAAAESDAAGLGAAGQRRMAGASPVNPQDDAGEADTAAGRRRIAGASSADPQDGAGEAPAGARLRRGLPRVAGGEPWPPASVVSVAVAPDADARRPADAEPVETPTADGASAPTEPASTVVQPDAEPVLSAATAATGGGEPLRRGLPRAAGGEPWPPAGRSAAVTPALPPAPAAQPAPAAEPAPTESAQATPAAQAAPAALATEPAPAAAPSEAAPAAAPSEAAPVAASVAPLPAAAPGPREPLQDRRLAQAGVARRPAPRTEPDRIGPFTKLQWAGIVVVGGGALLYAAAMAVLAVRWLLSLEPLQDFLTTYPGEYHLPESAPVGFPAWVGWQHFFNAFLMVLVIRTGLQVRTEKRPSAFWTSKKHRKRKMSLTLWLHQSLDVLWLANGVIFVILLFNSGQWMRIIPTSWEVFPNALSAALQYVSLDWPTENGWVNYNALQQIAYFTTVFIAAPIAAITGYRMSAMWPKNAAKLNELYPVEWARKLHFPTMLYFVVFILIHVALVLATGALRNLNHMYAAQGSVDPNAYADNWTGFWMFVVSLVVIAGAFVAARPLVVAPIARLFGNVSGR